MARVLPVAAAVLLLAAACGDDGGATTTTTIPGVTTTASVGATTTTAPDDGPVDEAAILGQVRDRCAAGDFAMCDVLYFISPLGSDFEAFGDSCGQRNEPAGLCVSIYDVSIDFAVLRSDCTGGDMLACDTLYAVSPLGSADEDYGRSCGARGRDSLSCMFDYGMTTSVPAGEAGGDRDISADAEALRLACAAGDYVRCDMLFLGTPLGSDLEAFGDSCGERNEPAGWCADIYDVSVDLAAARAGCTAGDMLACDMLFIYSPDDSADKEFGRACGGVGRSGFACWADHGL